MAFKERLIDVTFRLGKGAFGNSGMNTIKLSGLRTSCKIVKAGGAAMSTMQLEVYGMHLDQMNELSTLGMAIKLVRVNYVTVEAGTADGMAVVFSGTITNAWADLESAPDAPFRVEAQAGLIEAVQPLAPTSLQKAQSVDSIMSKLAQQMGLKYENNGVNTMLPPSYLPGSPRDQAKACAEHAGCSWIIDDGILAIWPVGGSRKSNLVPLISKDTGLVRYPAYTSQGVMLRTLFNPAIRFGMTVEVQSELGKPANGTWVVYSIDYDLESLMPKGQWFTTIGAARPGLGPLIT